MLALSTASVPEQNVMGKETHFKTWNATKNAILNSVIGNHGFPMLFDEFSANTDFSVTDLIYSLANGKDRSRLNKECEERLSKDFQTTIISTGEASIFNKTSKNTGLQVRVLEFANLKWTNSAEHSNRVKNGCRQNYGWAIYEFAKSILSSDKQDILEIYYNLHMDFVAEVENPNQFTDRVATRYAILLLTVEIFNITFEEFGVSFDYDKIFEVLLNNEKKATQDNSTDLGKKAYESFIEFVETNRASFLGGLVSDGCYSNECYGRIQTDKEEIEVPRDKFFTIIKKLGFEDGNTILEKWKEMSLLNHDVGKLTRKRKLYSDSKTISCIVIKYESEEKPKRQEILKKLREEQHSKYEKQTTNELDDSDYDYSDIEHAFDNV
jgi:hypothetical protein